MSPALATAVFQLTLGDKLRKAREAKGISAKEMAEYLDVHRNTISAYENDHITPQRAVLIAWAARTDVPLDVLTDDEHVCVMCGETRSRCSCASAQVGSDQLALALELDGDVDLFDESLVLAADRDHVYHLPALLSA